MESFPAELLEQTIYGYNYFDLIKLCSGTMNLQVAQENEALSVACRSGDLWINKALFDISSEKISTQTYFNRACLKGWTLIVNAMLQSEDLNFNANDKNGICLVYAVLNNHIKVVELLLKNSNCRPDTVRNNKIPIIDRELPNDIYFYEQFTNSQAHDLSVFLGYFDIANLILADDRVKITNINKLANIWKREAQRPIDSTIKKYIEQSEIIKQGLDEYEKREGGQFFREPLGDIDRGALAYFDELVGIQRKEYSGDSQEENEYDQAFDEYDQLLAELTRILGKDIPMRAKTDEDFLVKWVVTQNNAEAFTLVKHLFEQMSTKDKNEIAAYILGNGLDELITLLAGEFPVDSERFLD